MFNPIETAHREIAFVLVDGFEGCRTRVCDVHEVQVAVGGDGHAHGDALAQTHGVVGGDRFCITACRFRLVEIRATDGQSAALGLYLFHIFPILPMTRSDNRMRCIGAHSNFAQRWRNIFLIPSMLQIACACRNGIVLVGERLPAHGDGRGGSFQLVGGEVEQQRIHGRQRGPRTLPLVALLLQQQPLLHRAQFLLAGRNLAESLDQQRLLLDGCLIPRIVAAFVFPTPIHSLITVCDCLLTEALHNLFRLLLVTDSVQNQCHLRLTGVGRFGDVLGGSRQQALYVRLRQPRAVHG